MNTERSIFKNGSTTFYICAQFFPKHVKQDVYDLYSFLRVADDYVDQAPPDTEAFYRFRKKWETAITNESLSNSSEPGILLDDLVIKNMVDLTRKHNFELSWVSAFLDSMEADLTVRKFLTMKDTLNYVHGSAEVIGLMMARVMNLPEAAQEAAMLQGRAMQYINFIRDIAEDNRLGRCYFPAEDLKQFGLKNLTQKTAQSNPRQFADFIYFQIQRYNSWQLQADTGYKYIPRKLQIPLRASIDMHDWTARQILQDPFIIYESKVKPSRVRIMYTILTSASKLIR